MLLKKRIEFKIKFKIVNESFRALFKFKKISNAYF